MLTRASVDLLVLIACALTRLVAAQAADEVPSGHRTALLLGNAKYEGFTLPGVSSSLDEVERELKAQGFAVLRRENLKEEELKDTVEEFAASVPTNGVVVVYYMGLSAHVQRFDKWYNLLRPVGEKIDSDNAYRDVGLNVNEDLIEPLQELSGARVNLIFLDACWDSPILPEKGNVFSGIAEFEVGEHVLVMSAAGSKATVPVPEGDAASLLARSLARNVAALNGSVEQGCQTIAKDVPQAWIGGDVEAGIGSPSLLPVIDKLAEGRSPGEGFVNSIGISFRWCPPGSFTMGSDDTDEAATRDRQAVQVKLSKGFWMGEHEVTQGEYYKVMRKTVSTGFTTHKNAPFWGITEAKQITEFCKKLSDMERKAGTLPSGWEYVCPSEAEWEYACRAGSKARFCYGDNESELGHYGNFADAALRAGNPNYYWAVQNANDGIAEALAPVGGYRPNAWGLRDMHGNVSELVADHHSPELPGGTDPAFKVEKEGQPVLRGGSWCSLPLYCESSFRNTTGGRDKFNYVGFRIALKRK